MENQGEEAKEVTPTNAPNSSDTQAPIPAPITERATGPTTLFATTTGTAFIASSHGGWMCNGPCARARARRPLNQLSIDAVCQAGGDVT